MKFKLIFSLFSLLIFVGGVSAQDLDPAKALKKAGKLLGNYNLSPSDNYDKLVEAKGLIQSVVATDAFSKSSKAWLTYGTIFNELIGDDVKKKVLDEAYELKNPFAGIEAFNAAKSALQFAEKKFESKDALNLVKESLSNLNYIGDHFLNLKEYGSAFKLFQPVLAGHKLLKENGLESVLKNDDDYNNQLYLVAVSGLYGEMLSEAKPYFNELRAANYDNAAVYEGLYKIALADDDGTAPAILAEGREKFPDDTSLLFNEINYYLKEGKMSELIGKLEVAIEKEPNNVSLYTTLGNVYDNLYQKAAGTADAAGHYANAEKYYSKSMEIAPDKFEAFYSMGALYYNKAALLSNEVNALSDDYSKEGTAKYEAKKVEMDAMFAKALPFFEQAESRNANDMNTLIALKEIYARQNKLDKASEYKDRIEALGN